MKTVERHTEHVLVKHFVNAGKEQWSGTVQRKETGKTLGFIHYDVGEKKHTFKALCGAKLTAIVMGEISEHLKKLDKEKGL